MKHPTRRSSIRFATLFGAALALGCRSPEELPPRPPKPAGLPSSALAGAVRALEALAAIRPGDALTQVRALECDTLHDSAADRDFVRVFLDVTVYAPNEARAGEVFAALQAALEAEAGAESRLGFASLGRTREVLGDLDWDPPGREDLASYSDRIRLEVRPGRAALAPGPFAGAEPPPVAPIETYVRTQASHAGLGALDLLPRIDLAGGFRGHIRPAGRDARYLRSEIAEFLAALEQNSPAVRVTHFSIERSPYQPDTRSPRGWTFEADLSARGASGP